MNISGVFKGHVGHSSARSNRLWQPFVVSGCKQYVQGFKQKVINRYKKIYSGESEETLRKRIAETDAVCRSVRSIYEFDTKVIAPYNGFKNVFEYYDAMATDPPNVQHCRALSVHACDDPLITMEGMLEGVDPELNSGRNARPHKSILMLTETGGHMGWPRDSLLDGKTWKFVHDVAFTFFDSCSSYDAKLEKHSAQSHGKGMSMSMTQTQTDQDQVGERECDTDGGGEADEGCESDLMVKLTKDVHHGSSVISTNSERRSNGSVSSTGTTSPGAPGTLDESF